MPGQRAHAGEPQQCREQRERRQHREGDRDGRSDRDTVEERHADGEHAGQRDADRDPGEDHAATRGGRGAFQRFRRWQSFTQALPVAGEHEQRVVDAHAEPEQRGDLRADLRHGQHVRQQHDHGQRGADRHRGGHHRQHHARERAERDQQDDRGREQADAGVAEVGRADGHRGELARDAGGEVVRLCGFDELAGQLGPELFGGRVEGDGDDRGPPVGRHEWRRDLDDVVHSGQPADQRVHLVPGRVDRAGRGDDDAFGVTRGQQLRGSGAVRGGQRDRVPVRGAGVLRGEHETGEGEQPQDDHPGRVPEAPRRESCHPPPPNLAGAPT